MLEVIDMSLLKLNFEYNFYFKNDGKLKENMNIVCWSSYDFIIQQFTIQTHPSSFLSNVSILKLFK